MKVTFNFTYTHSNGLMTRLLNYIKRESKITIFLNQNINIYSIQAKGEQNELEALGELISSTIPLSFFLESYELKEIEDINAKDEFLKDNSTYYQTPYCLKCQNRVIDKTLANFNECEICGDSNLKYPINKDFYEILEQKVKEFLDKGFVTLNTIYGDRIISINEEQQNRPYGILICDIEKIKDSFVATDLEIKTLTLIEKPIIILKPKFKFKIEKSLKNIFYDLFLADDLITLVFSNLIKLNGINQVFASSFSTLKCTVTEKKAFILNTGRDILPMEFKKESKLNAECKAFGFYSNIKSNLIKIDYDVNQNKDSNLISFIPDKKSNQKNSISFKSNHGAIQSIIFENSLYNKTLCGIHLSNISNSEIFSYSPKIGYNSMVKFKSLNLQPKEILKAISEIDDNSKRLINNFKNKYEKLYNKIQNFEFKNFKDVDTITELFGLTSVILGFYDGDDIYESAKMLQYNAIEANLKSGPRVDYKIKNNNYLDALISLKSAISFKLAGANDILISLGFVDSLADFIATKVENIDKNISIDAVAISGNLFENRQLLKNIFKVISPNYPIFTNKKLSMDRDNIVFGALML